MRKTMLTLLLTALLLTGCGQNHIKTESEREDALDIVVTVFPAYDFTRAVAGELANVTLLLPPGAESHSYEPTPADILAVQNCDLFLYLGGESDTWVETILSAVELQGSTMRMIDCVELLGEAHVEGMQMQPGHDHDHDHDEQDCDDDSHAHEEPYDDAEHDHEEHQLGVVTGLDEHVWTSPKNAAEITRHIGERLAELDSAHAEAYLQNAEAYAAEIDALHEAFRTFFDGVQSKTIIFGDRFPLQYFAEEYDLDYYAAFPGCSTQTEPSAASIAFLTDKVRAENISHVMYIEFSNHLVADSIAEACGKETALFHTCHNVSRSEIEAGETYVSLMTRNLETLKTCMR